MKNTLLLVTIAAAGIVVIIICLANRPNSSACVPVTSMETSNVRMDFLDQNAFLFSSSSQSITGRSEGGGEQVDYADKGRLQIVEQRFYGETGRAYARFYYGEGGVLFAITKLNLSYDVPIYVDPSANVRSSEKKDFYLNRNGTVCRWFLNDEEQTVDGATVEMVREYIAGIL